MNIHSSSGKWLGHPYLSSVPAAAAAPEHRHKQQQGSVHCVLVSAGRRATTAESETFVQTLEIFSWEIKADCEIHWIFKTPAGNHSQVSVWAGSSLSSQADRSAAFLLPLYPQQRVQVRQHCLHTLFGRREPSGVSCASASPVDLQREQCFSQPGLENKRTDFCWGAGLWCLMTLTLIQIQARMGQSGQGYKLVLLASFKFQKIWPLKNMTFKGLNFKLPQTK